MSSSSSSPSASPSQHISNLLSTAEKFTESGHLEDATAIYNEILRIPFLDEMIAFRAKLSRARNFLRIAQKMKGIASSTSDMYPRSGLDLNTWCEMTITECERLIQIFPEASSSSSSSTVGQDEKEQEKQDQLQLLQDVYTLRIEASLFAEQPLETSRRYVISALCEFPKSEKFQQFLDQQASSQQKDDSKNCQSSQQKNLNIENQDPSSLDPTDLNLICTICHDLLCDPITLSCGHTFDRECLSATLDHATVGEDMMTTTQMQQQKCPLCRVPLHIDIASCPSNLTLSHVIQTLFPQRSRERLREAMNRGKHSNDDETTSSTTNNGGENNEKDKQVILPLMVSFTVSPGHVVNLQIFEPRYRLMIRRCLNGSRQFVLLEPSNVHANGQTFHPVGILVKIKDSVIRPDGRIMVSGIVERRVRVASHSDMDGYRLGVCEEYGDDDPKDEREASVIATACRSWAFEIIRDYEKRNSRFIAPPFCRDLVFNAPMVSVEEVEKKFPISKKDDDKEQQEQENDLFEKYFSSSSSSSDIKLVVDPSWAKENFHKIIVPVSLWCGEFHFAPSSASWQNSLITKTLTRLQMCKAMKYLEKNNSSQSGFIGVETVSVTGIVVGTLKNLGSGAASMFKNSSIGRALGY